MFRRQLALPGRIELVWMFAGFAALQLAIGAAVEHFWHEVRDPEYVRRAECLRRRWHESPGRPLILALGSSRMQFALRAEQLDNARRNALVYNFGIPASGPLLQQITLRRLLDEGIRPDFVFVEVMPMSFSLRGGLPLEESSLDAARLQLHEVLRVSPHYTSPRRLFGPWLAARAIPAQRHQAELGALIGLDHSTTEPESLEARMRIDSHGWLTRGHEFAPEANEKYTQFALRQYRSALDDGRPAQRMLQALSDLVGLCRRENIAVALMIPPEGSVFRSRYGAGESAIDAALEKLARDLNTPLYDARNWVPDDGFWDGHHLHASGAACFTRRFAQEALPQALRSLRRTTVAGHNPR